MLQPLPGKCGSPCSAAYQETAGLNIAGGPGQVTDPLQAKHRVEDIKRNHGLTVIGIGGGCGDPGRHRTGFGDAFLEHLTFFVFAVIHQLIRILGFVELSFCGIDTELSEHAFHSEGAAFIRYDGYDPGTDLLVTHQGAENTYERHGR